MTVPVASKPLPTSVGTLALQDHESLGPLESIRLPHRGVIRLGHDLIPPAQPQAAPGPSPRLTALPPGHFGLRWESGGRTSTPLSRDTTVAFSHPRHPFPQWSLHSPRGGTNNNRFAVSCPFPFSRRSTISSGSFSRLSVVVCKNEEQIGLRGCRQSANTKNRNRQSRFQHA